MSRFEGSLARTLDFGEATTTTARSARAGFRLARRSGVLGGPDKYRILAQRRRQAQIKARRLLDLLDAGQG